MKIKIDGDELSIKAETEFEYDFLLDWLGGAPPPYRRYQGTVVNSKEVRMIPIMEDESDAS